LSKSPKISTSTPKYRNNFNIPAFIFTFSFSEVLSKIAREIVLAVRCGIEYTINIAFVKGVLTLFLQFFENFFPKAQQAEKKLDFFPRLRYNIRMIILGLDPGLATLGYGIIEKDEKGNCKALDCGVVVTPKEETLPVRLAMLEEGIAKILSKYKPNEIAIEELFFSKNITTGIAVAHARGVALLTCVKYCGKLYEYTPMQIKQALTGYGKADKKQMQLTVTSLLKLNAVPKPDDAADALAVALCHAYTSRFGELFSVGNMTRTKGKNASVGAEELIAEAERRRAKRIAEQRAKKGDNGQ
jgi:crossover junction endodeoxyribonuclease RuvC